MNEQELRSLVRDTIARLGLVSSGDCPPPTEAHPPPLHASHAMFTLTADPQADGRCVIESGVMCNHCGYCKSWGY